MKLLMIMISVILMAAGPVSAGIDVQSLGWDNSLEILGDLEIDLSEAKTGQWDTQPPDFVQGAGIYDPDKWAIVFHYSEVFIAPGATVTFKNHKNNPPVVWLVQGNVEIQGTINLRGENAGVNLPETKGGPGGFRGGRPAPNLGHGFGPGGGRYYSGNGRGGSYGSIAPNDDGPTYGNPLILPLIGGSGGAGSENGTYPGGGGGGALMIAAGDTIFVWDTIRATGGSGVSNSGSGSGGSIKLVTDVIAGTGSVLANYNNAAGDGGHGRICILANYDDFTGTYAPEEACCFHFDGAGPAPQLWPDSDHPTAQITEINGFAVPTDPEAQLNYPWQDVLLSGGGTVICTITTTNVPTSSIVNLYAVKSRGASRRVASSIDPPSGNETLAIWTVTFQEDFENGMYALQARAVLP